MGEGSQADRRRSGARDPTLKFVLLRAHRRNAMGVMTPCNDLVIDLVGEAEATQQLPKFAENLQRMEKVLERFSQ